MWSDTTQLIILLYPPVSLHSKAPLFDWQAPANKDSQLSREQTLIPAFPWSGDSCDRLHLGLVFDILTGRFPSFCLRFHFHVSVVVCFSFSRLFSPPSLPSRPVLCSTPLLFYLSFSLSPYFLFTVSLPSHIRCSSLPTSLRVILFSWTLKAGKVSFCFVCDTVKVSSLDNCVWVVCWDSLCTFFCAWPIYCIHSVMFSFIKEKNGTFKSCWKERIYALNGTL